MSIARVEVESSHGASSGQRLVYFRCTDEAGGATSYGPIITCDTQWDAQSYCEILRAKLNKRQESQG